MKPKKGSAWATARALDQVRGRRNAGVPASGGAVHGPGFQLLGNGALGLAVGELFFFDGRGRLQMRDPAAPLSIQPGSPPRLVLGLGDESVRVAAGGIVARPTLAQVVDPDPLVGTLAARLDRKANTADARFPIAVGTATLVAGTVTVALTTIEADAVIVATHKVFGGTPGLLSWTVSAGADFTITSANVADVSEVSYAVWNP